MSEESSAQANGHVHTISPDFEWSPDYDSVLESIASSDNAEYDWTRLRDIIKYKLNKNIADYLGDNPSALAEARPSSPASNPTLSPRTLTSGGLHLPPFPKRQDNEVHRSEYNSQGPPKTSLTAAEAEEAKEPIFEKLDDFEGKPPFTIQRLCELCLRPRQHYKSAGKYLRAVLRTVLVTSTWDSFPQTQEEQENLPSVPYAMSPSTSSLRETMTPLFSPITFLHDDARSRSRSRSPPLSPLDLSARRQLSPHPSDPSISAVIIDPLVDADVPALGLVDELDDPSPGHMADHPHALSSVTSAGTEPIHKSLQDRFVSSSAGDGASDGAATEPNGQDGKQQDEDEVEDMVLDEREENKENAGA